MNKTELDAIMACLLLLHRENQLIAKCIGADLTEENQERLENYFERTDRIMMKAIKKVGLEIEE